MWPQIAREQLGAGNAGFATSWELPGSWEPGSLLRKDIAWEAILGIKTTDRKFQTGAVSLSATKHNQTYGHFRFKSECCWSTHPRSLE